MNSPLVFLRDGSTTIDSRLGRIYQYDVRCSQFPMRRLLSQRWQPRSYTWPVGANMHYQLRLDQGLEGACVGFAFAHELAAKPVIVPDMTKERAFNYYKKAQTLDEWEGEEYSGTSVLAGVKFLQKCGYYKSYAWTKDAYDLAVTVSLRGPCVLGINWHEGMWNTDKAGFIKPEGPVVGGHAILCKGFNAGKNAFMLHNSWGAGWGMTGTNAGCAWLGFNDMQALLNADGEACLPLRAQYEAAALLGEG